MKICPLCENETTEEKCPRDGYQTVTLEYYKKEIERDRFIGKTFLGKYKIISKIGSGGMGVVYKGINKILLQDVAIKMLKIETDAIKEEQLKAIVKRFHREALATSKLNHPNIIKIYDFGQTEEGIFFIVMEYLDGKSLAITIEKEAPFDVNRTINIVKQISSALDEAHTKNIVHRDLKPENIFLLQKTGIRDFVKVLDFGIAKMFGGTVGESSITKTGTTIGSPPYMSPEQAEAEEVDYRTDLYSLGIITYYMLTRRLPFIGPHSLAIMMKHKLEIPPPIPDKIKEKTPPNLEKLIFKLLEKDKEKRPDSAKTVLAELDLILKETPFEIKPEIEKFEEGKTIEISKKKKISFKNIFLFCGGILLISFILFFFLKKETEKPKSILKREVLEIEMVERREPEKIEKKYVYIESKPSGAKIFDGNRNIGNTPFNIAMKNGEEKILILKKEGHKTKKIKVRANQKNLNIKLDKIEERIIVEKEEKVKEKEKIEEKNEKPKTIFKPWREKAIEEMEKMMEEERSKIERWRKK